MTNLVDARGLSCPQPVILTKNALQKNEFPLEVLVDSATSRENVRRLAEKAGLKVQVEAQEDGYKLTISR